MPTVTVVYGEQVQSVEVEKDSLLGEAIAATGLPIEQPCAGKGTCGKCKVLCENGVAPPDEIEFLHLSRGELALDNRLACRARITADARVVLSPIVIYSNKIFRASHRYKSSQAPLGLAVDLGSTTVAAFLTLLESGEVQAGGASLNQQSVYGADVISRIAAGLESPVNAQRLQRLALASINQAVDSLKLSDRIRDRIERVTIVGNVAMHHSAGRVTPREPRPDAFSTCEQGGYRGRALPDGRNFSRKSESILAATDWGICGIGCVGLPCLF